LIQGRAAKFRGKPLLFLRKFKEQSARVGARNIANQGFEAKTRGFTYSVRIFVRHGNYFGED
jgi:hypothetical protein